MQKSQCFSTSSEGTLPVVVLKFVPLLVFFAVFVSVFLVFVLVFMFVSVYDKKAAIWLRGIQIIQENYTSTFLHCVDSTLAIRGDFFFMHFFLFFFFLSRF